MDSVFPELLLSGLHSAQSWLSANTLLSFVLLILFLLLLWLPERRRQRLSLLQLDREKALLEQQLEDASIRLDDAEAQNSVLQNRLASLEATLEQLQQQSSQFRTWWESAQQNLLEEKTVSADLQNRLTEIQTAAEAQQQHFQEQIRLLQENKQQIKTEFELLANEILERKGKAFKEINRESIEHLLNPIKNEMQGFREKVEAIHSKDLVQRAELKAELVNLQKLNQEITTRAEQLTTALQGQKKIQGNWGELMLENVLDSSGLRPGEDYKREVSFTTEEGRRRPDAIVYLPQDKHLVIDAKTSLAAYTRYVNADDDGEREQALAEHAKAVEDRINELSDRDYYKLPGLNSPEVVIMFIPIESAYVEALRHDSSLYRRAIERNVLVATPTTLLTSLNIVRQLWQFEDRNKHTAELASRAEKFYAKLNNYLGSMLTVGQQLDKAKDTYEKAFSQLYSGRGNLIKQASEFKDLGVSVKSELPAELVEKAHLELGENRLQDSVIPDA